MREAAPLADSLETLLAEAKGFRHARFEYGAEFGIKPRAPSLNQPNDADVVVVTLKAFDPDDLALLFASLRRAFPHRSVLAATTEELDILQVLQMGASDFLLPPLRPSELLPRLLGQARVTRRGGRLRPKAQRGPRPKADHRREACLPRGGAARSAVCPLRCDGPDFRPVRPRWG